MNSKPLFYLVVPAVVLAIVGLLLAQVFWFKNAFQLKEELFQDKVFVLINHIGHDISKKPNLQNQISTFLHSKTSGNSCGDFLQEEGIIISLHQIIDSVFQNNNIHTPFHFGIFQTQDCVDKQILLSDFPAQQIASNPFHTSEALACFIPEGFETFFLGLSFPKQHFYLLKQTGGMLGLSFLLILILLSAFAYTLYVVRRQKKLSEIKNDFLNNLTHELKTPLASIALASKVLQKNKPKQFNSEAYSYLQLITKESKRLENHIDKVLQIAVMDSGNFSLDINELDLHEIIQKVVTSCNLLLKEKKGNLQLKLNASNTIIHADGQHLFNMFYNLLDNAIKYSMYAPEIVISTSDMKEGVCFQIQDKGIGMDEEVQRNIFEKFYRASSGNAHRIKGFGLGLSYVKSIVEAHRGSIRFKSALNRGTEFTILLPL